MKAKDLTKTLHKYTSGWVAINKKTNEVVIHAKSFKLIAEKVKKSKDMILLPASSNYFGFITRANG